MSEAKAVNQNVIVSMFITAIVALLLVWAYAIAAFGYPAIIMPALALTGFCLVALVIVTYGR